MERTAEELSFLGKGWSFPILPTAEHWIRFRGGEAKIQESIWIILSTAPGERIMLPEFGCGIHEYVFQPNTAALRGVVRERVREALVRHEPRIDIVDVTIQTNADDGNRLDIAIDYRVRANNSYYNLVYPLFLSEGAG